MAQRLRGASGAAGGQAVGSFLWEVSPPWGEPVVAVALRKPSPCSTLLPGVQHQAYLRQQQHQQHQQHQQQQQQEQEGLRSQRWQPGECMCQRSPAALGHTRDTPLCSMATTGRCGLVPGACRHVHGDVCPFCKKACLHPLRPEVSPRCTALGSEIVCCLHGKQLLFLAKCGLCEKPYSSPSPRELMLLYFSGAWVYRGCWGVPWVSWVRRRSVRSTGRCAKRNQRKLESLRRSQEIEMQRVPGAGARKGAGGRPQVRDPVPLRPPPLHRVYPGWRATGTQGEATGLDIEGAVRACPVCRVQSHFVTPSVVWYFSPQEKEDIVSGYKRRLRYAKLGG